MAIVHHPESGISFCDVHYQVADTAEECAQCAIGTPRPTAWIDYHAIERWQQRISRAAKSEVITALQRIVTTGDEVMGGLPHCRYYVHRDYPTAVVVWRPESNAVVTVLERIACGWIQQ
jgi:hypothetical protein